MIAKTKHKETIVTIVMVFILISQAIAVAAANNQGLQWGFGVGERFDYDIKIEYHNSSLDLDIDDEMYIIIGELPTIPDDITGLSQLTIPSTVLGHYTTYWSNGTMMNTLWENSLMVAPFKPLPIGNWVLMTDLLETATPSADITQDTTTLTFTVEDIPNPDNIQSSIYQKSDGAPLSFLYNVTWGSETTEYVELTREAPATSTNTNTGDDYTLLLAVGGVAVAVIAIIAVVARKKP